MLSSLLHTNTNDNVSSIVAILDHAHIRSTVDKVKQAFGPETSDETFAQQYGVPKPGLDHYLILSCRTGRRSQMALEAIAELGYRK